MAYILPIARASSAAFVASVDQRKAATLNRAQGAGPPAWLPQKQQDPASESGGMGLTRSPR